MVVIGLTLYRSARLVLSCCFLVRATDPDVSKWLWILPGLTPNMFTQFYWWDPEMESLLALAIFHLACFLFPLSPSLFERSIFFIIRPYGQLFFWGLRYCLLSSSCFRGTRNFLSQGCPFQDLLDSSHLQCFHELRIMVWSETFSPLTTAAEEFCRDPHPNSCNQSRNINFTYRSLWLSKRIATILDSGQVIEYSKYNCKETHRGENKTPHW